MTGNTQKKNPKKVGPGSPAARQTQSMGGSSRPSSPSPLAVTPTIADNDPDKSLVSVFQSGPPSFIPIEHRDLKHCPCGQSNPKSCKVDCSRCKQIWHADCLSFKGIPESAIKKMLDYLCPYCYVAPVRTIPNDNEPDFCNSCRGTRVLQKANSDIESALTDQYQKKISDIIESTTKTITDSDKLIKSLKEDLESLKMITATSNVTPPADPEPDPSDDDVLAPPCKENPVADYKQDFLTDEQSQQILDFLEHSRTNGEFIQKNGRQTIAYGVPYRWATIYNGNKDEKKIPDALQPLIERAQEACGSTSAPINSILVNYYPAKNSSKDPKSLMPAHSDNENEITPQSTIATYSLGATREMQFTSIHDDDTETLEVESNSLYLMTKSSQSWFKHSMLDVDTTQERYSVVMRNVDPLYCRSTLIVGDSNTKEIKFGSGKGTLGEKYPGEKIKASRIQDIDPAKCVGYSNVVLVCGTNDLRPVNKPDVTELSQLLLEKVKQLRVLNPLSKIILMPVLPTRNRSMNRNVMAFNRLVGKWVLQRRDKFIVNPFVHEFLDNADLMGKKWVREGDADGIHLGPAGLCKFISIIKTTIYLREKFIRDSKSQHKFPTKTIHPGSRKPV